MTPAAPPRPDARLAPPAARQGPGPMPEALVRSLELPLERRVADARPGDRRAPNTGAGTELSRLRPYQPGDDVRHLDAAATARTGQPHVRLHVPERALTTWIVLDVSPSMAFGTAGRLKADVAEGVALALGRLAVARGGGLALARFGADGLRILPPHSSRRALVGLGHALAEGVARDGQHDPHALGHALERIAAVARLPGLVAIVSDFRAQRDWLRGLGALRMRHSVLAVEVGDPREGELPAVGVLSVVDPETGGRLALDTSSARVRKRFAELESGRRETLVHELRRLRVAHVRLSTEGDWLLELGRALR
jgi:uncharacterized protein (DUF58 family)